MPLVPETLTLITWTGKCDGCSALIRAGWPTPQQAQQGLAAAGWYQADEGQFYCPACLAMALPDPWPSG
jgi:hypothetical protein